MYFSNNDIYKKFLTISLCTSLIACSCPKSITVDSIQKHDKKLTCKDVIMEINESEFYRRKAQSNKGAQLDYILNPLCYPSGFFSADRGQIAANDRLEYLNNIYDLLNCSEVDINNAGKALKRVLQPNNDARNMQLQQQQRQMQQMYQPQMQQYMPNVPSYKQPYNLPHNMSVPRPSNGMIQKGIGYIPRQVLGTGASALKNLGIAGVGVAAGTAVGASGKAISGAGAIAGAVTGVGIGAAAGAFGSNSKQQQENRPGSNGREANNYNEYEDVRSAKRLYEEMNQGEYSKTPPKDHDFDFLPIPVRKPQEQKAKTNTNPVKKKSPTNVMPKIPVNAIPLLGGSKHPSYEACVSYSGCLGHNNNIVDTEVDSKEAKQQLPIMELPKSEPVTTQKIEDKANDLEAPISENNIKDIEEMIDMENMDHDIDSYMDKINDTQ